jgi:hypothetical protein
MAFKCIGCDNWFKYENGGLDCFKCDEGPYCYDCVSEHRRDCRV